MTDPKVAALEIDLSAEFDVERETQEFLREAVEYGLLSEEEKAGKPAYQTVFPEFLREWLIASVAKKAVDPSPSEAMRVSSTIAAKVNAMVMVVAKLDAALSKIISNTSATIASRSLYADHPGVLQTLGTRRLGEGEAALVALPGYWSKDVTEFDKRADCLMAVIRWNGVTLSRPVLCNLETFEKQFSPPDHSVPQLPEPNVHYVPSMGKH